MSLLKDAINDKKFDVRMLEKNLARGFVDVKDYDHFLGGLKDDAENSDWINLEDLKVEASNGRGRSGAGREYIVPTDSDN